MKKIGYSFLLSLFTVCCTNNNNQANNNEYKKHTHMEAKTLYPDSLTEIQRKCVEKKFEFIKDPQYEDSKYPAHKLEGYMTDAERDALIEISILQLRKRYKSVEDSVFSRRFQEVFGYEFNAFVKLLDSEHLTKPNGEEKISNSCIEFVPYDPYRDFYISQKEKVIVDKFNFGGDFEMSDDIKSFTPTSRLEQVSLGTSKNVIETSSFDYIFHLNNYLFNEANVSRTWLLNKDKYFMAHLLIQYGYDGDNEINKMVLKAYQNKNEEVLDMPVEAFHIYPDGKVKILDGLLKTAADMSTAECGDYFDWATSIVYLLNGSDDSTEKSWRVKYLTMPQRREIIGHIVDYMQPVYEKYLGSNDKYGPLSYDFGDLQIIDCFWNSLMQDHDLISEIEKNNYYGLPHLESLIVAMKDFKPFYDEKTGEFEPWNFIPMRYRDSEDED